jgi:hypothetical protein
MSEDPDLERRLEAMFGSARPRRGFEDELWRRIEAQRPWHQRLGRRFQPALRYAPALATILVVALGVTWLAGSLRGGPAGGASTTSAGAPGFGSEKALAPSFGVLPSVPGSARSATAPQATTGNADAAAGINFSGTLPSLPAALPVYRYDEPSAADRAGAGAALRAQTGLAVVVTASDPVQGVEAQYLLSGPAPGAAQGNVAATANQYLAGHGLTPQFGFRSEVSAGGSEVTYQRVFAGPAGPIPEVRPDGRAAGLVVAVAGGSLTVRGPLDLPLASASYPLRSATAALANAGVRQGSGAAGFDRAELVYVLVLSAGHGYYEPELQLTGAGGTVLVPVIAATWLAA